MINRTVKNFGSPCLTDEKASSRFVNATIISENAIGAWDVKIYPNPASSELYVQCNMLGDLQITIIDITGKTVLNDRVKTNNNLVRIKLDLRDGIYFVTLNNFNNEKVTKKLVITR